MNDIINSSFEFVSGLLSILNIIKLYKDKSVSGFSVIPIIFFVIWRYWNLYYYPSVDCKLSLYGTIIGSIINTVWLGQIFYYSRKPKSIKFENELTLKN